MIKSFIYYHAFNSNLNGYSIAEHTDLIIKFFLLKGNSMVGYINLLIKKKIAFGIR